MLLIWPSTASRTSRNKSASLTDAGVEPEDPLPVYAGVGLSGSRGRAGAEVAQLRAQDTQHGASALGCGACAAAGVAVHGARLLVELEAVSGRRGRVSLYSGLCYTCLFPFISLCLSLCFPPPLVRENFHYFYQYNLFFNLISFSSDRGFTFSRN